MGYHPIILELPLSTLFNSFLHSIHKLRRGKIASLFSFSAGKERDKLTVYSQNMCDRTPVVYLSNNLTAPQAIRFQEMHFRVDFLRE